MNNPTFEYTNNESKCTLEDNGLTTNIIDDLICNPKFDNVKFMEMNFQILMKYQKIIKLIKI
jgi:hypothetical protein